MTISKRTRFEILRRDDFRCYYCGTRGTETGKGLTIDHVVPVALGGTDNAENLVSACGECNSGKTSTSSDSTLIAAVDQLASMHRAARSLAMRALEADLQAESDYLSEVLSAWDNCAPSYAQADTELESIASNWFRQGVPIAAVEKALRIAWENKNIPKGGKVRYAGGVVRNMVDGAEDRAQSLASGNDTVWNAGYDAGWHDGNVFRDAFAYDHDLVASLIDGNTDTAFWRLMSHGT